MKHKTLPFFVPHAGCPHQCAFCNQHTISGVQEMPSPEDVRRICAALPERTADTTWEIAFFGGSFTAIEPAVRQKLLEAAAPFVEKGRFDGIRISTRPDAISDDVLAELHRYGVTAIELGAQSMNEQVLKSNGRGHTAADTIRAAKRIRAGGFSLGLQQMVGLYRSTLADEYDTLYALAALEPDTMRIYPTVILRDTPLAALAQQDVYPALSMDEVIGFCADAIEVCAQRGIRLIRLGLQDTTALARSTVGGYYHPAIREAALSRIYQKRLRALLPQVTGHEMRVVCGTGCISQVIGYQKCNKSWLAAQGITLLATESDRISAPWALELNPAQNGFDTIL